MRHAYWFLVLLLLSACHLQNTKPSILKVTPIPSYLWQMSGKMSFSDGHDGGSGRITWKEQDGKVLAKFSAPLGQGSWWLDEQLGRIRNNKGQSWSGEDMGELLSHQLGWEVPWDALKQSIKGVAIHKFNTIGEDELSFEKQGWQIQWKKIKFVNGLQLPHRIFLTRGSYSVKISIKTWSWQYDE